MNTGKTYVIFDGDNDIWAYGYMKGWNALPNIDFDLDDAHEVYRLYPNAPESVVKRELQKRFALSNNVIVLVGEHTKYLYKYVRWEIEAAQMLDLPIIVVNLNDKRTHDVNRCPPILSGHYAVHVSFEKNVIKHALENFPSEYYARVVTAPGDRHYSQDIYKQLGL